MWMFIAAAMAADLHVELVANDFSHTVVATSGEPLMKQVAAPAEGKTQVAYEITVPPAPHSVVDNGYPLEITVCRIWAKGKKKDRDCITEKLVAHPASEAKSSAAADVKLTSKWSYTLTTWASGDIPSTEMPMEPRGFE